MNRKRSIRRRQRPPFSERAKEHCRHFTAFLFSNVGIILLVILYTIAGAFIFQAIEIKEAEYNPIPKAYGETNKTIVANLLWNITCCEINGFNESTFKMAVQKKLLEYQKALIRSQWIGPPITEQWSFAGSFLYSLTVITTIGYGNIAPKSDWGKVTTIIYAIIGMPLFLLYLSNIGDILAKSFKWLYAKICLCRICPVVARRRAIRERRKIRASIKMEQDINQYIESTIDNLGSPYPTNNYDIENNHPGIKMAAEHNDEDNEDDDDDDDDEDEDDDTEIEAQLQADSATITVPLTVCICIMIGYILFGATLFQKWENWPYLDGSYFCFISLSSIGFGDIVPGDKVLKKKNDDEVVGMSFIFCAIYLLLGMAFIAMCFNLMQEQVVHEMRSIKRVIRLCFRCNR